MAGVDGAGDGGDVGARLCGACGELIIRRDGNPRTTPPSHCCKMCKVDLHSYMLCEAVWMPAVGYYFCSAACIKRHNSIDLTNYNKSLAPEEKCIIVEDGSERWADYVSTRRNEHIFAVEQTPEDVEALIDANCFACAQPNHRESSLKSPAQDNDDSEVDKIEDHDSDLESKVEVEFNPREKTVHVPEQDQEGNISDVVLDLTKEKLRIQLCYKQADDDESGEWFGGLVGCTRMATPFCESLVFFGLDDGELVYHSLAELQVHSSPCAIVLLCGFKTHNVFCMPFVAGSAWHGEIPKARPRIRWRWSRVGEGCQEHCERTGTVQHSHKQATASPRSVVGKRKRE